MSRSGQQRAILSWILSLPAPVLRLLSGGVATYREGRTLDPRLQFLAAGARRYMTKPLNLGSFLGMLDDLLQGIDSRYS